jgi:AmmeMemoRadiSam system protein B
MRISRFILIILTVFLTAPTYLPEKIRKPVDPVGYATTARQMDSLMNRIDRAQGQMLTDALNAARINKFTMWSVAVCPHDDYSYVGWLYPAILKNIKAHTVIIFGVAHKAKKYGLENKLIFDSFDQWQEPFGNVKISSLREKIMNGLPESTYIVHDSMQQVEHSVEGIVPFLQYYNRNVEIIPILVPYMSFNTMNGLANSLALSITNIIRQNEFTWKKDIAIVISTDAVHYGDEEWGGQNYAPYGTDSAGYKKAVNHEHEIISTCLEGQLSGTKLKRFTQYTVQDSDYHAYKWTWCGRYSVPFGLLVADKMDRMLHQSLKGTLVGYSTSLERPKIIVTDLGMGITAPANLRHWVGYAAVGYR